VPVGGSEDHAAGVDRRSNVGPRRVLDGRHDHEFSGNR
jgi:hypothetical protein